MLEMTSARAKGNQQKRRETKMEPTFKLEKAIKNTCRYQEEPSSEHPPVTGTLYIQKWFLGNPPPEEIKVIIKK